MEVGMLPPEREADEAGGAACGHLVILSSCHLVILSSCHPATGSWMAECDGKGGEGVEMYL